MLRRITAAALCVGVMGATAGAAEGAIRAGLYRGFTEQEAEVSLRVAANKKSVFRYSFEGAVLECSDGQPRQIRGANTGSQKFRLNRERKFGFTGEDAAGAAAVVVNGKIGNNGRASGTLRMVARVDETGSLNPNGPIQCDSFRIRWVALR